MKKQRKKAGLGFISTLTLLFIVLKLTGLVHWPWIWVLCPVWISGVLAIAAFSIILIVGRIKKGKW
jgi:Flp pilus assembly protein TadB